ncbi:thiamine phosphate synthase [Frateuria defendens]|uniref:thiamine phosphate synthase n=1 Tax=Frateuria defendens TaxID=2219559 RepID=UPI00066FD5C8|nr:thiamine phosphate synthase [Frateuria defendens]
MNVLPSRGLYAITNGPRPDLLDAVAATLAGGASMVQYRDKTDDDARRHAEAQALQRLCAEWGVPLIVNDDVALARAVGATGVHLGFHDASVAEARAVLGPGAIIGVGCYASLERARAMVAAGADYVGFGAFHPSTTKPHAGHADPELLRQSASLGVPRVAIGGITPDNGAALIEAGADLLAAVSAVFGAGDIRAAAQRFAGLFPSDRTIAP